MDIETFSKLSFKNGEAILKAEKCSCYYCLRVFDTKEVKLFVPERTGKATAICPHCDIDALIPGEVPKETLEAANDRWFGLKLTSKSNG